jgi:hypothetical protein
MSGISIFTAGKAIINTLVRLAPVALYTGSATSGLVFEDFRAVILLVGFILNEAIAYGYRIMFQGIYNPQCALMKTPDDYFVLPSPITQTIGFFAGFFLMDMYNNGVFAPMRFFFLCTILIVTIYSRINIGCKTLLEALYCAILGMILGVGYYNVIKEYYRRDFYKTDESTTTGSVSDFFNLGS